MRTVYLDTNIFGDLATGTIPVDQLTLLRKLVGSNRIRILYSMAIMDEQAKHCIEASKPWAPRAAALAHELCARKGVHHHTHIIEDELLAMLAGKPPPSAFMTGRGGDNRDYLAAWKTLATNPTRISDTIAQYAQIAGDEQETFRLAMRRAREAEEAARRAPGRNERLEFLPWRRDQMQGGQLNAHWAEVALAHIGKPKRLWKRVLANIDKTPAVRMLMDIHLAYAFALLVWGMSTRVSFGKDIHHSLYASRCNALVTQDGDFRKVLQLIPRGYRPAVLDWTSFFQSLPAS